MVSETTSRESVPGPPTVASATKKAGGEATVIAVPPGDNPDPEVVLASRYPERRYHELGLSFFK